MSRLNKNNINRMFAMNVKLIKHVFISLALAGYVAFVGAAETVTYFHNDALGSPVAATDESGNVLWREAYKPYGSRILEEDNGTNDTWYTGKQEDKATGLSYFGARWYDPTIGRFMGIDPVGFKEGNIHSFNRYAYVSNNPYKYVDPDGRARRDIAFKITFSGGGGGGGQWGPGFSGAAGKVTSGGAGKVTGNTKKSATKSVHVPKVGDRVYRVWGGEAGANGRSWSRTDPKTVDNYRDAAGLPNQNSGRFVTEGTLTNTKGVAQRDALSVHGNKGGLGELVVPNPGKQIRVDRVSGANPEF